MFMIRPGELNGRTHEKGLESEIPELVSGTREYEETVRALNPGDDLELYGRFAEKTDRVVDAVEEFFDEIQNALYLLDNGSGPSARKHVSEARESYLNAFGAYRDLAMDRSMDVEFPETVDIYFEEIREGLEEVEKMAYNSVSDTSEGFSGAA